MDLPDFLTRNEYGAIRLAGSRIDLEFVVHFFNEGESAEAIARRFPTVDPAHIPRAIAFYLANRAAVDEYVREGDALEERLRAANPGPDWDTMRRKVEAMKAERSGSVEA